ncbi:CehA/McbA family metallohydrolase [Neobacillus drentensis]|uniref:CehA/McbA family metallohydrolase n=1 Tax=Neobacillus drentensis TaxID=220684 RepID=UPI002FFF8E2F
MKASYTTTINGVVHSPAITLTFDVEQKYDWIELSVSLSKNGWYSILIWDPTRCLRAQSLLIKEPKKIFISSDPNVASFGAVAGEIETGCWTMEILSSRFSEEHHYAIQYIGGFGKSNQNEIAGVNWAARGITGGFELNQYCNERIYKSAAQWYKGDFHTHTTESDGKMTPKSGMNQAKKMELDFFAATDHNIIPTKWTDDSIMVLPGVEITSSKGHFNALGLTKWIDWRPNCHDGGMESEEGMNRIIREVKAAGAIVSINHPMLKPWEWQYRKTLLATIDIVEIWNDPTYKDNPVATEEALHLWNNLWNDGYRIFGIGGSDSHLLPTESYEEGGPPSVIGDPATYVFCQGLSARALLDGVKNGRAYVSRGPEYLTNIIVDGESYLPGSDLSMCFDWKDEIHIWYEVMFIKIPDNGCLWWIRDGIILAKERIHEGKIIQKQFTLKKEEVSWIRFEIRSLDGELLSFINPIYSGEKKHSLLTWGDLLKAQTYSKQQKIACAPINRPI